MEARRAEAELERRRADALLTACDLGLTDDVAALIAGGATFEATDKAGVRPMTFAAARGHADVVELLCSHGVDANDDDALGRAPLHFAAMHDRARVVRALASRPGTWVDPPDHLDDTPLTLAARMAGAETVAALLDAGADARARNKAGLTPLGEALLVRRRFDLADLLLEHEARETEREEEAKGAARRDETSGEKRAQTRRAVLENTKAGPGGWSLGVAAAAFGAEDVLAWLRNEGVDVDAALLRNNAESRRFGLTETRDAWVHGDAERKTVPFASLSSDAKLKTARGWASVPAARRAAFGSGVPPAALPALEERDALVLETEKRDFLQKLIDDDEFQEDMRLASVRDAVDAVVRDFHAVVRFRGDERIMRVLEKFRVVQRFCKARGFKITYADVRVADAAEAEQRRKKVGELRERADAALAAACRAALAAERDQTRPNAPETRKEKEGVVSATSASGRTTGRSPSKSFVSEVSTKKRVFAVLGDVIGAVLRNQTVVVSLVAALCAFIAARVVERRERVSDGDGG
jgi:ankyrin repeat protein